MLPLDRCEIHTVDTANSIVVAVTVDTVTLPFDCNCHHPIRALASNTKEVNSWKTFSELITELIIDVSTTFNMNLHRFFNLRPEPVIGNTNVFGARSQLRHPRKFQAGVIVLVNR